MEDEEARKRERLLQAGKDKLRAFREKKNSTPGRTPDRSAADTSVSVESAGSPAQPTAETASAATQQQPDAPATPPPSVPSADDIAALEREVSSARRDRDAARETLARSDALNDELVSLLDESANLLASCGDVAQLEAEIAQARDDLAQARADRERAMALRGDLSAARADAGALDAELTEISTATGAVIDPGADTPASRARSLASSLSVLAAETTRRNASLSAEITDLTAARDTLISRIGESEALAKRVAEAEFEAEKLRRERDAVAERAAGLAAAERKRDALAAEVRSARDGLRYGEIAAAEISALEDELREITARKKEIAIGGGENGDNGDGDSNGDSNSADAIEKKRAEIQAEIEAVRSEISALESQREISRREIAEAREIAEGLGREREAVEAEVRELAEEIKRMEAGIGRDSGGEVPKELLDHRETLRAELDSLKAMTTARGDAEKVRIQAEIDDIQREIDDLNNELAADVDSDPVVVELKKRLDKVRADRDALRVRRETLEREHARLGEDLSAAEREAAEEQSALSEFERRVETLRSAVTSGGTVRSGGDNSAGAAVEAFEELSRFASSHAAIQRILEQVSTESANDGPNGSHGSNTAGTRYAVNQELAAEADRLAVELRETERLQEVMAAVARSGDGGASGEPVSMPALDAHVREMAGLRMRLSAAREDLADAVVGVPRRAAEVAADGEKKRLASELAALRDTSALAESRALLPEEIEAAFGDGPLLGFSGVGNNGADNDNNNNNNNTVSLDDGGHGQRSSASIHSHLSSSPGFHGQLTKGKSRRAVELAVLRASIRAERERLSGGSQASAVAGGSGGSGFPGYPLPRDHRGIDIEIAEAERTLARLRAAADPATADMSSSAAAEQQALKQTVSTSMVMSSPAPGKNVALQVDTMPRPDINGSYAETEGGSVLQVREEARVEAIRAEISAIEEDVDGRARRGVPRDVCRRLRALVEEVLSTAEPETPHGHKHSRHRRGGADDDRHALMDALASLDEMDSLETLVEKERAVAGELSEVRAAKVAQTLGPLNTRSSPDASILPDLSESLVLSEREHALLTDVARIRALIDRANASTSGGGGGVTANNSHSKISSRGHSSSKGRSSSGKRNATLMSGTGTAFAAVTSAEAELAAAQRELDEAVERVRAENESLAGGFNTGVSGLNNAWTPDRAIGGDGSSSRRRHLEQVLSRTRRAIDSVGASAGLGFIGSPSGPGSPLGTSRVTMSSPPPPQLVSRKGYGAGAAGSSSSSKDATPEIRRKLGSLRVHFLDACAELSKYVSGDDENGGIDDGDRDGSSGALASMHGTSLSSSSSPGRGGKRGGHGKDKNTSKANGSQYVLDDVVSRPTQTDSHDELSSSKHKHRGKHDGGDDVDRSASLSAVRELTEENTALQSRVESLESAVRSLTADLDTARQAGDTLRTECETLRAEAESLTLGKSKLHETIQSLRDESIAEANRSAQLSSELSLLSQRAAELERDNAAVASLRSDLASARGALSAAKALADEHLARVEELERAMTLMDPTGPGSPTRVAQERYAKCKEECDRLTMENEGLEGRITEAERKAREDRERAEREAEQRLRAGVVLAKHSRQGGPTPRILRVANGTLSYEPVSHYVRSTTEAVASVDPRPVVGHEAEKAVRLRTVLRVNRGSKSSNFGRAGAKRPRDDLALSVVCESGRTVDLVALSTVERDAIAETLERLIAREAGGGRAA